MVIFFLAGLAIYHKSCKKNGETGHAMSAEKHKNREGYLPEIIFARNT